MTKQDLNNLTALCEAGARAIAATKSLAESAQVLATAVVLLEKISKWTPHPEEPITE